MAKRRKRSSKCCKCKGRKANGQLKKGYTIKSGRVVRAKNKGK